MNTFGRNLRITTFGESHGPAMGGIIDEDLNITVADLQNLTENERYRKLLLAVCRLNYGSMPFLFERITD